MNAPPRTLLAALAAVALVGALLTILSADVRLRQEQKTLLSLTRRHVSARQDTASLKLQLETLTSWHRIDLAAHRLGLVSPAERGAIDLAAVQPGASLRDVARVGR